MHGFERSDAGHRLATDRRAHQVGQRCTRRTLSVASVTRNNCQSQTFPSVGTRPWLFAVIGLEAYCHASRLRSPQTASRMSSDSGRARGVERFEGRDVQRGDQLEPRRDPIGVRQDVDYFCLRDERERRGARSAASGVCNRHEDEGHSRLSRRGSQRVLRVDPHQHRRTAAGRFESRAG